MNVHGKDIDLAIDIVIALELEKYIDCNIGD
jgi:hypothetical protein